MNRKQKIIVSITVIFIVLLALVGLTYAYFLTRIRGNEKDKSISVTTANLELTYNDGTDGVIGGDKLEPSDRVYTKTFTVENTGNANVTYGVYLIDVINEFVRKDDIKYTMECTTTGTLPCGVVEEETTFPSGISELSTASIEPDKIHTYTFKFTYKDSRTNQSVDMNKKLEAKIQIFAADNKGKYLPYETDSLAFNIINNSINEFNGTSFDYGTKEYVITGETPYSSTYGGPIEGYLFPGSCYPILENKYLTPYDSDKTFLLKSCKDYNVALIEGEGLDETIMIENPAIANEKIMSIATDDYGTTYYFRGNVSDNYVNFAEMCWRIVRIQGDGSIKLILASELSCSEGNLTDNSGYVTDGERGIKGNILQGHYGYRIPENDYNQILPMPDYISSDENNSSSIRTQLNSWLNRKTTEKEQEFIKNDNWCIGDLSNLYAAVNYVGSETVISDSLDTYVKEMNPGGNSFSFSSDVRYQITKKPSFICDNTGKSGEVDINKIGMLTMDEIVYAGGGGKVYGDIPNPNYFLNSNAITNVWPLLSVRYFDFGEKFTTSFAVKGDGSFEGYNPININTSFRASITLKPGIKFIDGTGIINDPYIVEVN